MCLNLSARVASNVPSGIGQHRSGQARNAGVNSSLADYSAAAPEEALAIDSGCWHLLWTEAAFSSLVSMWKGHIQRSDRDWKSAPIMSLLQDEAWWGNSGLMMLCEAI